MHGSNKAIFGIDKIGAEPTRSEIRKVFRNASNERVPIADIFEIEFSGSYTSGAYKRSIAEKYEAHVEELLYRTVSRIRSEELLRDGKKDLIECIRDAEETRVIYAISKATTHMSGIIFSSESDKGQLLHTAVKSGVFEGYSSLIMFADLMTSLRKRITIALMSDQMMLAGDRYAYMPNPFPRYYALPHSPFLGEFVNWHGINIENATGLAWYSKGLALYKEGKQEQALEAYSNALCINPGHSAARAAINAHMAHHNSDIR